MGASLKWTLRLYLWSWLPCGRHILDSYGRMVAEVQEVKECVSLNASFSSLKARTLDDNTPK